jgi:hypothetical protein
MSTSSSTSSSPNEWMRLTIEMPRDDGLTLLLLLREKFGFDPDHGRLNRADYARVAYSATEDPHELLRLELRHLEAKVAEIGEDGLTPNALLRLGWLRKQLEQ